VEGIAEWNGMQDSEHLTRMIYYFEQNMIDAHECVQRKVKWYSARKES
jgi:hypothetical protein